MNTVSMVSLLDTTQSSDINPQGDMDSCRSCVDIRTMYNIPYFVDFGKKSGIKVPKMSNPLTCGCCRSVPAHVELLFQDLRILKTIGFVENNEAFLKPFTDIYRKITRKEQAPPRKSEDWTEIGFQREDPTTDLRASGMLGIVLPWILFDLYPDLGSRAVDIALIQDCKFPLMAGLITLAETTANAAAMTDLLFCSDSVEHGWIRIADHFAGLVANLTQTWDSTKPIGMQESKVFSYVARRGISRSEETIKLGASMRKCVL